MTGKTWTATLKQGTTNNVSIVRATSPLGAGQVKASASATISTGTWYTLKVVRIQRSIEYTVLDGSTVLAPLSYESDEDFEPAPFGFVSFANNVEFDNFSYTRLDQLHAPAAPRFASSAKTVLSTGGTPYLRVESVEYGGESKLEWAGDP